MRQAGVLAAAGLYAFKHNIGRLPEDHANAKRLAEGLKKLPGVKVSSKVETNMVFASFEGQDAERLCFGLYQAGLLAHPGGPTPDSVRFVTHLDVPAPSIDEALRRIESVLTAASG